MKKSNSLLIAIIIVIIIIIIIAGLLIYKLRGNILYGIDEEGDSGVEYTTDETLKRVNIRSNYYIVQNCVNKYYMYYAYMFGNNDMGDIDFGSRDDNIKIFYNMLDKTYVEENNITTNNISTKFQEIKDIVINITDMYVSERKNNINLYIVQGTLREKVSGTISDFKVMVKLDRINTTFSILPQDYVTAKYNKIAQGEIIEIDVEDSIQKNTDNMYDSITIGEEDYINDIVRKFKEEILYNKKLAYNHLDEEYRNLRFNGIEDFMSFAKNNVTKYVTLKVDKYQKTQQKDYTQYVILDKNGNYYIFKMTDVMKYTLILDTYTIDIPEFVKKYEESTVQEKVILNINKFRQAINDKNYKYAYNLLADSFKSNNFKTQADFENYVKTKFFENNEFSYQEFKDEANTYYTYKVKITDSSGKSNNEIVKTFIILLEEGTDFKLSFNV